jgi:filamentous hemagglutinin family protein
MYYRVIGLLIICANSEASVVLDGRLGPVGALPGPDFEIKASFGQQRGTNLFHSFSQFDLHPHETATFSGPSDITHVISRVTGNTPSYLNGLLRSTLPNADFFLLNPAGITFGEQAKLEVQGAFHASTADTLRLGDSENFFSARSPEQSSLAVAPPTAFGFLTNTPAAITVNNSQLSVADGKTLSLIGGKLTLQGTPAQKVQLFAKLGQVNLASIASPGEINLKNNDLNLSPHIQGGQLFANNVAIGNVFNSSRAGGNILIRAGQFELNHSTLKANRHEEGSGIIDIQANQLVSHASMLMSSTTRNTKKGGVIMIKANSVSLLEKSMLTDSAILSFGDRGSMILKVTGKLTLSDSKIVSSPLGLGKGGTIEIEADQIVLKDNAVIQSAPLSAIKGGHIVIKANHDLTLSNSDINAAAFAIQEQIALGNTEPTHIEITAPRIKLNQKSNIANTALGVQQGGLITITGVEELSIADSAIFSSGGKVMETKASNSGGITIQADKIILTEGAAIAASNRSGGQAGQINIAAQQLVLKTGSVIESVTLGSGSGGSIDITVSDHLTIAGEPATTTGIATLSSAAEQAGNAGDITIQAGIVTIDKGSISASATNAAGGHITLTVPNRLHLQTGTIVTNVKGGDGDGGNITIKAPTFVILDGAKIITQAKRGFGGDITIQAEQFILAEQTLAADLNAKNVLNASSDNVERSGTISTPTPSEDLNKFLVVLPTAFLFEQLQASCASRTIENFSDFKVTESFEQLPQPPEDLTVPMLY